MVPPNIGRPRIYCSQNCREAEKYFNAFIDKLDNICLTDDSRKLSRGRIMSFMNTELLSNRSVDIGTKKKLQ